METDTQSAQPQAPPRSTATPTPSPPEASTATPEPTPSQKALNIGLFAALILAGLCLLGSAVYLFTFLVGILSDPDRMTANAVKIAGGSPVTLALVLQSRQAATSLGLLSCGVYVGLSFGFLGFALFLMGIKGEIGVDSQFKDYKLTVARMSPGVFVLLFSAILVGVCVTHIRPVALDTYQKSGGKNDNSPKQSRLPCPLHRDASLPRDLDASPCCTFRTEG